MNLQPLFPDPIIAQAAYPAAYSDHTNDIWRVRTATEDVVVRIPRSPGGWDYEARAFWLGCRHLFGLDPTRPARLAPTNDLLARLCPIPVPRVLRQGVVAGHPCLVVERLPGERLTDLRALPAAALADLGAALARVHRRRFDWWGAPFGGARRPLAAFHARLAATLDALVARFFARDAALAGALPAYRAAALALPAPESAALVMIDVDATQFLAAGGRITGLVDTDAYVVAPRALDLIGYEYELDAASAAAFAEGYRTILPLPDLRAVRPVYRYLYRLLEVQGAVPLEAWMAWPALFDAHPGEGRVAHPPGW